MHIRFKITIFITLSLIFFIQGCKDDRELIALEDESFQGAETSYYPNDISMSEGEGSASNVYVMAENGSQDNSDQQKGSGSMIVEDNKEPESVHTVTVYICGAVNEPGVYVLDEGSRIIDSISAAKGMSTEAATSCLNLAEPLIDGSMIYVPTVSDIYSETGSVNSDTSSYSGLNPITPSYGQTPSLQGPSDSGLNLLTAASSGSSSTGMVNINTASRSELMTLNGIGEAKADKIIAYREEHGGFDSIEDIMNITGIKEGMFNKIKDQICVR